MVKKMTEAMRWAQLTLAEGDLAVFDPDYWLDYFKKSYCDGVVLGSGGYMSFHPTQIPYHYRAKTPEGIPAGSPVREDLFGYLVEESRKEGCAVICRTDGHAFHDDAFKAHPEWVFHTDKGEPRRHWTYPEVWVSCPLGDFGFDFMKDVNNEIANNYDIDAIFCNRWAGSGVCYCPSCQSLFKAWSGHEIPLDISRNNPVFRIYEEWRENRLFELCDTWDSSLRKINRNLRFIPNSTVGPTGQLNSSRLGEYSDILFCDRQARHGVMPPWFNGRNAKEIRAVMGKKPMGGIFSTGNEETPRWKDSVQEPTELALWVSNAVANGLRPWFTKFSGQLFDDRWMEPVRNLYKKYEKWEPYLKNYDSKAEVALMFSGETVRKYAGDQGEELTEAPLNGFYQALTEARVPFDMFDAEKISPENLKTYGAVILPNIAVLSQGQCDILTEYVEEGGSLIASYETSLYDEKGERRTDFGLGNLLGASCLSEKAIMEIKNSYIRFDSLGETKLSGRMIGSVNRVDIEVLEGVEEDTPFHSVPSYPDLPMEEVYPRQSDGDISYEEVIRLKKGKGRVVYFPGDLDRCFWEYLVPDHRKLLIDNVLWAKNKDDLIVLDGPGFLDVTVFSNDEGLIIHLVNMTTVNAMRGAAHEIIPLEGLTLLLRADLVESYKGKSFFLEAKNPAVSQVKGNYYVFDLPKVDLHEVLVLSKNS